MLIAQKEYSLLYVQNGSLSNKKLYIDYVAFKASSEKLNSTSKV